MSSVLLIVMPFADLDGPQLGVSLLKAQLRSRGIPSAVAYLNFPFAEAVGYQSYGMLTTGIHAQDYDLDSLAGEWMFARSLFSHSAAGDTAYIDGHLLANYPCARTSIKRIRRMAALVEPYLDHCLRTVSWDRYSVIGLTTTFEQNLASLALAKRIKERFPHKFVVMGGANCASVMGVQLHKSFSFLDYVFTGESDVSFPELVSRIGNGNTRRDDIPGHVHRENGGSFAVAAVPHHEMNALPYPDFDDYFAAYRVSPLRHHFTPVLRMETSRGCWWGAKHHCTFCGLNQNGMAFRGKSPERAIDEVTHLVSRYGVTRIAPTDNIISLDYFRNFLPELKRRNLGVTLFYETKANLNKDQVKLLYDSGVRVFQPGIESLSTHVLGLMRKGVSPLQNVQLLKWSREYGVHPLWNVLYGFPGETERDYEEICSIAENLSHLTPAVSCVPLHIERFSPYFDAAADFGVRNLRAHSSYRFVYPFDEEVLYNIAYFFECDYDHKNDMDAWSTGIKRVIKDWNAAHAHSRLEVVSRTPDSMFVWDTRPNRVQPLYRFDSREATVIDACDRAQSLPHIVKAVRETLNDSITQDTWIAGFLRHLCDCRLVLEHDERYLSLIVSYPQRGPDLWNTPYRD